MKRKRILIFFLAIATMAALAGCKGSGMALTSEGQLFKINIYVPDSLADGAEGTIDVVLSDRGVKSVHDILVDVELPPQLIVNRETHGSGVNAMHDAGSNVYHYTIGNLQVGEDSHIKYDVRTQFGGAPETGTIRVTAWQRELPGEKLTRTTVIKLAR
jgi:hypothetical protein